VRALEKVEVGEQETERQRAHDGGLFAPWGTQRTLWEGDGGAFGVGLERDDFGHHSQGRVVGVDE
jgi:hypothetical protein